MTDLLLTVGGTLAFTLVLCGVISFQGRMERRQIVRRFDNYVERLSGARWNKKTRRYEKVTDE